VADTTSPVRVGLDTGWTAVDTTRYATYGVRNGVYYVWGKNSDGELGLGNDTWTGTPTALSPTAWSKIGLGLYRSCGVRAGELYCWGNNFDGGVGPVATETILQQTRVGDKTGWSLPISLQNQSCGVLSGVLHCWGTTGESPNYGYGTQWSPAPILSPATLP
jgi:hypothetical protein